MGSRDWIRKERGMAGRGGGGRGLALGDKSKRQ